jgi:hypothetical protein
VVRRSAGRTTGDGADMWGQLLKPHVSSRNGVAPSLPPRHPRPHPQSRRRLQTHPSPIGAPPPTLQPNPVLHLHRRLTHCPARKRHPIRRRLTPIRRRLKEPPSAAASRNLPTSRNRPASPPSAAAAAPPSAAAPISARTPLSLTCPPSIPLIPLRVCPAANPKRATLSVRPYHIAPIRRCRHSRHRLRGSASTRPGRSCWCRRMRRSHERPPLQPFGPSCSTRRRPRVRNLPPDASLSLAISSIQAFCFAVQVAHAASAMCVCR